MKYGFGVDIGGTTIKIGLFSVEGDLIEKWEIPTNKEDNGKYILTEIADFINRTIETKGIDKNDVIGVGLGVPGPVNKNGFVSVCVNLGWNSLNVEKEFHEISGLPVQVGNDANVAALGEMWQGAGKRISGRFDGDTRHWCWRRLCVKWKNRFRNSWSWWRNWSYACKG